MNRIRHSSSSILSAALVLAAVSASGAAATVRQDSPNPQTPANQVPTIKTTVRLVTLDVIVVDDQGHTVQGLTKEDFRLLEDGATQTISGFEEHQRPLEPQPVTKLPPNTFGDLTPPAESSAIVLMLDTLDSPAVRDQMYLRNQMIAYMKTVPEGTRMAIVSLDRQLHLIQGFTSDREALMEAILRRDKPALSPMIQPCAQDVRPSTVGVGTGILGVNGPGAIPSIAYPASGAGLLDPCAGSQEQGDPYAAQNAELSQQVLRRAMAQLMTYLSEYSGRKSLVWFYSQAAQALSSQANPSEPLGIQVSSMLSDRLSFAERMGRNTRVLTLNQIALTLVNTSPDWGAVSKPDLDSLVQLVGNANGLKEVVQHVEDKAWNYYTLSYSPNDPRFHGEFRKLSVHLRQAGLHIQYRPGYYAVKDDGRRDNAAATPPGGDAALESAMQLGAAAPRDILFTVHLDPAADAMRKTAQTRPKDDFLASSYRKQPTRDYRVRYTVDARTLDLKADRAGVYRGRAEFVCLVYDDVGNTVNSIALHASIQADASMYAALLRDGVQVEHTITIPAKGNFFLRLGVHDPSSAKTGVTEVSVGEVKIGLAENGVSAHP